ncbi:MAG TPA: GNAT family N-acetyltransferase [Symbiobacteriaceae bacterium]|nr:GNAT family N-acetyltransferase [Symbiobacteriaceae bacterium]
MNLILRPQSPSDYTAIAEMESALFGFPITPANVAAQEADQPFCGIVAELDGHLVGRGFAGHMKRHTPAGDMRVELGVRPEFRQQGIGRQLWMALQPFFAEQQPRHLRANGTDEQPEIVAWALRLGFQATHHLLFQSLDVRAFDPAPWQAQAAAGVQCVPFTELKSPAAERRLHALYQEFLSQTPDAAEAPYMDFEPWRAWAFEGAGAWPGGCLMAMDDRGEWLGFTLMQKDGADRAHVFMTGVVPEYRGRGVSTLLKVAAALRARAEGIGKLTTLNHAANERIVAVNRRMGYQVDQGIHRLVKRYADG